MKSEKGYEQTVDTRLFYGKIKTLHNFLIM